MKRLLMIAVLVPFLLLAAPAPQAEAAMTLGKAKQLRRKWSRRVQNRKAAYFQSAGRQMFWRRTLDVRRNDDTPTDEIAAARAKMREHRGKAARRWKSLRQAEKRLAHFKKVVKRLKRQRDRQVRAGKGWGGSEGVADNAKRIAGRMGIPITSQKRTLADTIRVGSSTSSDHYTGNTTAFAVDFGVAGSAGTTLARRIAKVYGIPTSNIGTFNFAYIRASGRTYRVQLLWQVSGHYDHVHLGIRRQ